MLRISWHLRVEDGDRPKPTAEPGVQYVLVLPKIFRLDGRVQGLGGREGLLETVFHHVGSIRKVVGRNSLTPPQLTADTPVAGILHPVTIGVTVFVRNEFDESVLHLCQGCRGQFFHLQEPLCAELWLDYGIGALGIAHRRGIILNLFYVSSLLKHLYYLLSGYEPVFPY